MGDKQIHTKKELKQLRKKLRHNLTPAEAFLWEQLKARKLQGRRFTKQHSMGNYIVDFYCAQECLIIELDGEVHYNPSAQEYDLKRTQFLNSLGYTVIRFENKMVFELLPSVLKEITENFNNANPPS
ncbi:MAG: endonuclease domain-containing protein [Flavobacteriaceae bacterium]